MRSYSSDKIRNIVLVSHGGSGKTTLTEALLFTSGATTRLGKIENGSTVADYDPEEIKRSISINTALVPLEWKETKINLLDTPGYFDFEGEVYGALQAADGAIMVINATSGVEVGTEKYWDFLEKASLSKMVVVNKLDRENTDFDKCLAQLQEFFGSNVIPIQIPIGKEEKFTGVVDLVGRKAFVFSEDGKKINTRDIPAEIKDSVEEYREQMIEAVAETDDELLEKYLEGETLDDNEIRTALSQGIKSGELIPVLCSAATKNIGSQLILDNIADSFPAPKERGKVKVDCGGEETEIEADSSGILALQVFKTMADPFVGKLSYVKIYSGVLKGDSHIYNFNQEADERIGQLFIMQGKNQINIDHAEAGDIAVIAKLQETVTGDTLGEKGKECRLPSIPFPEPVLTFAVEPKSKNDEEKVMSGLNRLLEEDPTLRVERNSETKQTLLSGMGDMHLEVISSRLQSKFGVEVDLITPKIPYRETIKSSAKAEGKHKKQSGGRGQFGHVYIEFSPTNTGEGFIFEDKIFGGSVPRQYIPAVEKGLRETLREGILAGYPMVDFKATLYDGSYHSVDSSEMAFKIAASLAYKKGIEQANPIILEPIDEVEIIVPENYMGDVIGDLNSRRGRIQGMEPQAGGLQKIKAAVPMAEMFKYSIDLRSMTQGRGTFKSNFSHYDEVPAQITDQIIAEALKEKQQEKE